jgi:uncharacterized protein YfeS
MSEEIDYWDIDPEKAHPKAVAAFTDKFWWDCTEDYGPFGNDDGHPVFADFREWRETHPQISPLKFWSVILDGWGVKYHALANVEIETVRQLLRNDSFSLHAHDQTIIAVAFAQIYVEGRVDPDVKTLAAYAIDRQLLPEVIDEEWIDADERAKHLLIMRDVLHRF